MTTTNGPSEDAIRRAKKLLALQQSPNEHEAALAASKLQELLIRHQINAADLALKEGKSLDPIGETTGDAAGELVRWKTILMHAVADTHLCKYLIYRGYKQVRHALIGRPTNTAIARETYLYLVATIDRLARQALREEQEYGCVDQTRAWGNSFRMGCAMRIAERLREKFKEMQQKEEARTGEAVSSMGLAICDEGQALASYMKLSHPDLKSSKSRTNVSDFGAYTAGRSAGAGVNLDRQVESGSRPKQIASGK